MLTVVRFWILLSTLLVGAGWILSAMHQLNRIGYGVVFAFAGIAFIFWQRKTQWLSQKSPAAFIYQFRRRCQRPAPLLFLTLALMSFAAGALYLPSGSDPYGYHLPRVLHWLGAEQWHWIHTFDPRLNIAGCGFEWLSAPLILFTHTDRFLFLINWLSFLMLPGLIFSVFTRLQVRLRVAWWWAWLLASGWCFALQAGSVQNDAFAAIYALAAVDLALRAREKKSLPDLWLSFLAAALLTNAKQTNLPLVLLWLVAAWPALRLLTARPFTTVAVLALGLLVSAVPVTWFNYQQLGSWLPLDAPGLTAIAGKSYQLDSPFWAIVGNTFCIPAQNLLPPIFPWTGAWNDMMDRFLQTPFGAHFASFEHFGILSLGMHGVSEENAGIGLGICILAAITFFMARRLQLKSAPENLERNLTAKFLRALPWLLLLVFMAKNGTYNNARQLAPYYPFLFPLFLAAPGQARLIRRIWWQRLGLLVMIATAGIMATSRSHPLFPARTILGGLEKMCPQSRAIARLARSYQSRSTMENIRNSFRNDLPPDERVVGFTAAIGKSEVGLWLPFGKRRVEWVLTNDPPEKLRSLGIHYVVVESSALVHANETIEQWLDRYHGDLVARCTLQLLEPPEYNYLVRLRPE